MIKEKGFYFPEKLWGGLMKKELQRKLSFVVFVMAVFFAGMALTVFQAYIWMACIAGVLLLAASVFFVMAQKEEVQSPTEKTTELLLADRMAELMRGNEKAEKGVYIAVKKQHEAMESGLLALQEKLDELVKVQENAVKTLVLYNKENAKQMALSEREELERLHEDLLQLQRGANPDAMSQVVEAVQEMSRHIYDAVHESGEAMLAELTATVDSMEEVKDLIQSLGEGGPVHFDRKTSDEEEPDHRVYEPVFMPEESTEEAEPDEFFPEEPEPEFSEEPAEEFAEEVESEPKKTPEDALASSGVDLSDPNKTLSADDIAALFAAMGN